MTVVTAVVAGILALVVAGILLAYGKARPRRGGPHTYALPVAADQTELDRLLSSSPGAERDSTRISLVSGDVDAFIVRYQLARMAGRSLDLQYYYWKSDVTGNILAREVLAAADRGVRVRLLLDDINTRGFDRTYLALNTHPRIEVRLFNPCRSRTNMTKRAIELVVHYFSATRRMHNKSWIADSRVAVVGGRNIGDAYFGVSDGPNFRDADLVATGRAVDEAVGIFDSYWNSQSALPITTLHRIRRGNLPKLRKSIDRICAQTRARSFLAHLEDLKFPGMAKRLQDAIEVEAAEVIADPPEKAAAGRQDNWISTRIFDLIQSADRSLAVCSPYFIPGRSGLEIFAALKRRGVQSCILTNSLAATDVMIVHSAYAKYRKPLIAHGVELYEQRPDAGKRRMSLFGSSTASLHTKAMVADRRTGFVGSFNLDPRSVSINTEMGIIFTSPQLASELADLLDRQMRSSFRLALNDGSLYWIEPGTPAPRHHGGEPLTRLPRRLGAWAMSFLPIESQL